MADASLSPAPRLTGVQWLICIIASIGFAFDIYELLMLPLIVGPALQDLVGAPPGSPDFQMWLGRLFYWPAIAGGVFGLFGGYLTDRLGRRRVLTWSILLYAFSAFFAGFSTSIWMLLILRCTTFIGVCVEFVAAVAWLAELFPNSRQKEKVLGYTQAFSSIGGLLVAVIYGVLVQLQKEGSLPVFHMPEALLFGGQQISGEGAGMAWRYTLMSGLIPAIPLIIIRPFLPESPAWQEKRAKGTLKRPSFAQLFSPEFARTSIITAVMFACSYGAAFGAIQQIPRIVPGLEDVKQRVEVALDAAEANAEKAGEPFDRNDKKQRLPIQRTVEQKISAEYVKVQEIGGLLGRFVFALLAVRILSRQRLLRIFQGPGLLIVPLVFYFFLKIPNTHFFSVPLEFMYLGELPITTMSLGVLLCGFFTVAQFSFWGNYLPRVYPMHLRGTGESFAANIGGRLVGTSFAYVTSTIVGWMNMEGPKAPYAFALVSAGVALFVYVVGFVSGFWLPEPGNKHDDH
jgi:MFS family permease